MTSPAQITPPSSTSCGSSCGNSCLGWLNGDNCCDDCVPGSGVIVGATWHILRPVINDNRAFTTTTTRGTTTATVVDNFQYGFKSDPSVWAGYRTCDGLGFTVTWFHLDNSANTETATATDATNITPVIGSGFGGPFAPVLGLSVPYTFNNDIHMDIWDFDVTQRVKICHFDLTFGAGIRYLFMAEDYNQSGNIPALTIPGVGNFPAGTFNASTRNEFNGGGPTLILNGVRSFGCSGFGLYANSRVGVLFGPKHEDFTVTANPNPLIVAGTATTTSDNESTIGFGEIELGAQWSRRIGNVSPFVRAGFEGREYWGIGNAGLAASGNNNGNVGLYGIALSAGVGW